ncbi:MAG: D-Ala-D-Ala carboxypeptidase family metallohydrolase [Hyphomicrobiaceae bacterium]|nr:D-Ala-D-Ala carboxypeptidase family metallohydrolase [Hyphomicrobiaceae bacterium]
MIKTALAAVQVSVVAVAGASAREMKRDEISALVSGTIVEIDTPLGKKIPIQHLADGRLAGDAGELASYLGARADKGRWWIEGDRLCQKWSIWFSGEQQCLRLDKVGDRISWTNQSGTRGTARLVSRVADIASPHKSESPIGGHAGRPAQVQSASRLGGPAMASEKPPAESRARADAPAAARDEEEQTPAGSHRVANVGAQDVLNVRAGPSGDDAIVGALRADDRGIRISGECRNRWCPITYGELKGWVNRAFLAPVERGAQDRHLGRSSPAARDASGASRTCLTEPARALLDTIEGRFGQMKVVSTCRPGAKIAGTSRVSRHASGNAIDFDAGNRKSEVVAWLIANHGDGGTMTYRDMDHIHVDIGRHFVSIGDRSRRASARREAPRDRIAGRMSLFGSGPR